MAGAGTLTAAQVEDADDLQQCRIHGARWGNPGGPKVLLLHAIGFDHRTWERLVPYFGDRFHAVGIDLPGHGRSDKPLTVDYGLWALGRRVAAYLDELGWADAVVVGNSIGGGTALSLALQAPEKVRGLALLNTVAYPRWLPALGRFAFLPIAPALGSLAPTFAVRAGLEYARHGWGTVEESRCRACNEYLRDPAGRIAFFRTLRLLYGPDLRAMSERYREIRCPTLVLHGVKDPLVRLANAEHLAGTIPSAELAGLARCGHFPQEECPQSVADALIPFLERYA